MFRNIQTRAAASDNPRARRGKVDVAFPRRSVRRRLTASISLLEQKTVMPCMAALLAPR